MIAIISGTGFGGFVLDPRPPAENRCGFPSATPTEIAFGGQACIWLPRHGPESAIPPHRINYRANLLALAEAGTSMILATHAVGALRPDWEPGQLVVPDQLIDYSWGRDHSFCDGLIEPLRFVDFTEPFDDRLRSALVAACAAQKLPAASRGVYCCVQGPRLETAAEVQRLIRDGGDLVGMTLMPEAALARELDIPYASLALVVNPAAGLSEQQTAEAEARRIAAAGMVRVKEVFATAVASLAAASAK